MFFILLREIFINAYEISVSRTDDHGYVPFVVVSIPSPFYLSWRIAGLLIRVTSWMQVVEQVPLTLSVHTRSTPVFLWCSCRSCLFMLWVPLRYPLCSDVRFVLTPHWFCREFLFFVCLTRFPYQLMLLSFNRTTGWMSLVETFTLTGHLTTPRPCLCGFIVLNLLSLLCGLFFELRFSE